MSEETVNLADAKKIIGDLRIQNEKLRSPMMKEGLCNRCESRVRYIETGSASRCECGSIGMSVYGCYMYRPVKPVVTARNSDDKRPQFAGFMLSARSHFVRIANGDGYKMVQEKDGSTIYWVPNKKPEKLKCSVCKKKILQGPAFFSTIDGDVLTHYHIDCFRQGYPNERV